MLHASYSPSEHVALRVRLRDRFSLAHCAPSGRSSLNRVMCCQSVADFVPPCVRLGDVQPLLHVPALNEPLHDDHGLHAFHAPHAPLLHVLLRDRDRPCDSLLHTSPFGREFSYITRVCLPMSSFVAPCTSAGPVQPCLQLSWPYLPLQPLQALQAAQPSAPPSLARHTPWSHRLLRVRSRFRTSLLQRSPFGSATR